MIEKVFKEYRCRTGAKVFLQKDAQGVPLTATLALDYTSVIGFSDQFTKAFMGTSTPSSNPDCIDAITARPISTVVSSDITIYRYSNTGVLRQFDLDITNKPYNQLIGLPTYNFMLHEVGHALGLSHVNQYEELMYYGGTEMRRDFNTAPTGKIAYAIEATKDALNRNLAMKVNCQNITGVGVAFEDCSANAVMDPAEFLESFTLFPNPTSNEGFQINYELRKFTSDIEYSILDNLGRVVFNKKAGNQSQGIYIENFTSLELKEGLYIFKLLLNGKSVSTKFIKI